MAVPATGKKDNNTPSPNQPLQAVDPKMAAMPAHIKSNAEGRMKTNSDKISYSLGFQAGGNIMRMLQGADVALLSDGFHDAIGNHEPALERREMEAALKFLEAHMQQQQSKIVEELSAKNKEQEAAFFEKIKLEKGVKSLVDGIHYEIIKSGSGATPSKDTSVIIHISAALLDGKVIENSFSKEAPKQFHMSKIGVQGLHKALLHMKVGDRWKLFFPSEQAFGIKGFQARGIEPGSAMIYEVELLQIIK
ncbi:MAG: FKBP-type peptidyl-prolyl cis-trans isomerase N-terminal domain-containing protein [Rhabdochlamydiaceae bacterium]|jgi:FKBP-type peptidyl-prolyl cis-trans isomerase FklB